MALHFIYAFAACLLLPWLIGYPLAALAGCGRGLRGAGYGMACGLALLLIACRGLQMAWPVAAFAWWLLAGLGLAVLLLWSMRGVRGDAMALLREHGGRLAALLVLALLVGVLLDAPTLFGNAIEFEGNRNADSFTFVSTAQYMLAHAYNGAYDFTPEHPVYTITRSYLGQYATQPRPAAEGLLAWLSALRGVDPMYLYNAVQAAGAVLAGWTVWVFAPMDWRPRSRWVWMVSTLTVMACPTLLFVAVNSNFANLLGLPALTAYVALALMPRGWMRGIVGALLLGALMSGYPEMMVFAAMARGLGVVFQGVARRDLRGMLLEAALMAAELALACAAFPWAAHGSYIVYRTTFSLSAGHAALVGNMYAGAPLAAAAAAALALAWRGLARDAACAGMRSFLCGILAAFALAQLLMCWRGFDYGGLKISEYFAPLLLGVLLACLPVLLAALDGERSMLARAGTALALAIVLVMAGKSASLLRKSWAWAKERCVTADLVHAGEVLPALAAGHPVALGETPQPYYYGMWFAYLAKAAPAYDFAQDTDAAGYLSAYLAPLPRSAQMFGEARLRVDIDEPGQQAGRGKPDVATFGAVHVRAK
ncbi:hypothetical protein [Dyella sp. 2RAB6]|uniref:hypothetical protein n=1 Tax=Dyella sp. 2RAB6 TaxID=3232992 RepID=UPI003F8D9513